ncbi:MAG: ferritin [Candidatus Promineifilaceae bacterium]|nr:ferritin [Candidatus Promineifilaceae bacterium]
MMIIKQRSVEAMNEQIESEFLASAQYLAIAIYFDEESLPDLAQFFYRQSDEERMHAMKFVHFLLETGAKPIIPGLPDIRNEFGGAAEAVQYALNQELKVTDQINNLVKISVEENDFTSHSFLQWFVNEQVEEVDTMTTLLQTIKHAAGNMLLVEDFVRRFQPHAGGAGGGE